MTGCTQQAVSRPNAMTIAANKTEVADRASAPLTGDRALRYVERRLGYDINDLLVFPKFLCIETTNQCNARCVMCGVDFGERERLRMSDSLYGKILEELAPHAARMERVGLFVNCEPLMDPDLEDRITELKEIGIRTTYLNSNASLLFPQRAESLIRAGLDRIHITIDSLDPDRYEAIRRGLKFHDVYENTLAFLRLRDAINPKLLVRIQMVGQAQNRDEAEAFVEHWRPLVATDDQVVVTRGFNWGKAADVERGSEGREYNHFPCIALWSTLEILADGDVHLCCVDVDGEVGLGNAAESTVEEIWRGDLLARARQAHLSGQRERIRICDGCAVWWEDKYVCRREADEREDRRVGADGDA
ncbi:radical SAM/SPASM domain-containing protein [Verrucomicrobiota bacterium]